MIITKCVEKHACLIALGYNIINVIEIRIIIKL